MKVQRNAPCPCGSGRKAKNCCRTVVRGAVDVAGVLFDKGLVSEGSAYALIRLNKWNNLTGSELLQAMKYEQEFNNSEEKIRLMEEAIRGSPIQRETDIRSVLRDSRFQSRGYEARDYSSQPVGTAECCSPLPSNFLIPRSDWAELVQEQEKRKATLTHTRARAGIKTYWQNGTNHCWAFGSVKAAAIVRAYQGLPTLDFSPTMVACLARNYGNVGGNTFHAIPVMAKVGIATTKTWTLNRISRNFDTPEMRQEAALNRLREWYELPSNSFAAAASCLLRGMPVILGLAWWGHMVCGLRLVVLGRDAFGIEIDNSHGEGYGNKGLAILDERRATAFDQAAPRVMAA